jgi:hypothetical protein
VQAVQACNDTERELLRTLVNAGHLEFGR